MVYKMMKAAATCVSYREQIMTMNSLEMEESHFINLKGLEA